MRDWSRGAASVCSSSAGRRIATHAVDVGEHIYKGVESLEKHDAYIRGLSQDVRS